MTQIIKKFFHWAGIKDLTRQEFLVVGLSFLIVSVVQLYACPSFYVGLEHDDGLYVLAAKSLALLSYKYQFLMGTPPITMTPGYPFLLLPVALVARDSLLAFQLYNLLLLNCCTFLVWVWFRRKFSVVASILFMAMFGLNPLVLYRVGVVMPEISYLFVSLLLLIGWDRVDKQGWAIGFGLAALYLIRPAGVGLVAAIWLTLVLSKKWKQLLGAVLIPVVVFSLWATWSQQTGGVQENVELKTNYSQSWMTPVAIVRSNVIKASQSFGESFFLPPNLKNQKLYIFTGLAFLLLALIFAFRQSLKSKFKDPEALYCLMLFGIHALWPWWFSRYALPLLPFVLRYTVGELAPSTATKSVFRHHAFLWIFTIVSFLMVGRHWVYGSINPKTPPYRESYHWIQDNTDVQDVVASILYGRDVLYMNRIASPIPYKPELGAFCNQLDQFKVKYIFWENKMDYGFSVGQQAPVYSELTGIIGYLKNKKAFELVYSNSSENVEIFRVHCGNDKE